MISGKDVPGTFGQIVIEAVDNSPYLWLARSSKVLMEQVFLPGYCSSLYKRKICCWNLGGHHW